MRGEGSGYVPHDPYGQCPRCGSVRHLSAMRQEWSGLRVCGDCWDEKPVELDPPRLGPEGLPRHDAMPMVEGVDQMRIVTADDL